MKNSRNFHDALADGAPHDQDERSFRHLQQPFARDNAPRRRTPTGRKIPAWVKIVIDDKMPPDRDAMYALKNNAKSREHAELVKRRDMLIERLDARNLDPMMGTQ